MTSQEKILALRQRLLEVQPETEEDAQMLQLLVGFSPFLLSALPSDADELDRFLAILGTGAIACRSDGAAPMAVQQLVEGSWEVIEL